MIEINIKGKEEVGMSYITHSIIKRFAENGYKVIELK